MKALALKQVMVGRPVRYSFGGSGALATFWICVLLPMCNLLLFRFGTNVGAELSPDGLILLNFSSRNVGNLGQCRGDIESWNSSDDTPCGWIRVFCNTDSAVRKLDFSGCSLSNPDLDPLMELGSLREMDLSSNRYIFPYYEYDGPYFTGLTWLDISGSWYGIAGPGQDDLLGNFLLDSSLQYLYAEGEYDGEDRWHFWPEVGKMRELLVFSCAGSGLEGDIPEELGSLTKLVSLDLSSNFLSGSIPNLEGLTRLIELSVTNNDLSGDVPSAPILQYLDAAINSFTNLTDAFFQMSALTRVNLSRNQLGGQLPDIMFPRLEVLDLSWNVLRGPIPTITLPDVTYLDLSHNSFSGPIPTTLPHVTCQVLNLSHNNLSGPIPPDFGVIPPPFGNVWVDLSGNELNGSIPASLLYPGTPNEGIYFVNLSSNSLVGSIPDDPWQQSYSTMVYCLDLSDNQLSGPLPPSFSSHHYYDSRGSFYSGLLWLAGNQISGDLIRILRNMPTSIRVQGNRFTGDLTNLLDFEFSLYAQVFDLNHNNLTMMPSENFPNPLHTMLDRFCSKGPGLNELRLAGSDLMGQLLPDSLNCSHVMDSLQVLDLASCNLSGTVPEALFNDFFTNLTFLNVSNNNRLSGPIPSRLPATLRRLDLGNSNMEGEMPPELFISLPNLLFFNVSCNKLSGSIPATFPLSLQVLDLRNNNLTGEIPPTIFFALPNLKYINLSGNNLSGTIPLGLRGDVYNATSFADNPGLCGGPLQPCIPPLPPVQRGLVIKVWVLVIIGVAVVLVCTGSCLLLLWRWKVYSKKHQQDAELIATLLKRETVTVMSLRELRKATSNFSESAQIGVGGFGTVYTGQLANGTAVAIKKGKREGSPEYKQQFLNEVRILSGVNHRYLVKLLGCSMENKVALLVFEFVPNGTLQEHLQGRRPGFSPLSWRQRLLIALQTSDALAYLHSAADPPIIHRDVKSANILLDHQLNAKVADFGISKLAPSNTATHVSTAAVQGTMGYIDPEYYVSLQLTPRSDVYSFGVVLLELISGKSALDRRRGEDEVSLAMLAFSARDRGEWQRLVDPVLADTYSSDHGKASIESVGGLAFSCLALKARERPEMKEVRKELQTIWLQWDSDASFQPDDGQHDPQPQHDPYTDAYASNDSMSLLSSRASLWSSSSTSGPQIEMQHIPGFDMVSSKLAETA